MVGDACSEPSVIGGVFYFVAWGTSSMMVGDACSPESTLLLCVGTCKIQGHIRKRTSRAFAGHCQSSESVFRYIYCYIFPATLQKNKSFKVL